LSGKQFKALFHFLNERDAFTCFATGHGKTLIYQNAVLVARTGKVKILPSNPLVVVVSPLNALTSDGDSSAVSLAHCLALVELLFR